MLCTAPVPVHGFACCHLALTWLLLLLLLAGPPAINGLLSGDNWSLGMLPE
jgi:hypothetical protein